MSRKASCCSVCGCVGHDKRNCPQRRSATMIRVMSEQVASMKKSLDGSADMGALCREVDKLRKELNGLKAKAAKLMEQRSLPPGVPLVLPSTAAPSSVPSTLLSTPSSGLRLDVVGTKKGVEAKTTVEGLCRTMLSHIEPPNRARDPLPEIVCAIERGDPCRELGVGRKELLHSCHELLVDLPDASRTASWDTAYIIGRFLHEIEREISLTVVLEEFDLESSRKVFSRAIWFFSLLQQVPVLNNCVGLTPRAFWKTKRQIDDIIAWFSMHHKPLLAPHLEKKG
eukprot:TRINITY_DN1970_c0_g1_i1.p1 TRINITY_DN1970_c0_g1~~TRINITY_DN1970_c0_g1_i1.p1  ORF type:complete len:283 (-),score=62.95 TRINITY_DN1970_c0_g1_i1:42-890(-)